MELTFRGRSRPFERPSALIPASGTATPGYFVVGDDVDGVRRQFALLHNPVDAVDTYPADERRTKINDASEESEFYVAAAIKTLVG